MKLWQKIFIPSVVFTLIGIYLISLILVIRSHTLQLKAEKTALGIKGAEVLAELERLTGEGPKGYFLSSGRRSELVEEACVRLTDDSYTVTARPLAEGAEGAGDTAGAEGSRMQRYFLSEAEGRICFQAPVFLAGEIWQAELSRDIRPLLAEFGDDIRGIRRYGAGVALVISLGLLVMVLVITRPVRDLKEATKRIAEGNYGCRIALKGKDELSELAGYMNEMASRIEANTSYIEHVSESRRKFIANMTHELKTPLTSILGFSDVLRMKPDLSGEEKRQYADIIFAEATRLRRLSSRLMELISVEETELSGAVTDVGELVRREVEAYRPICEENKIRCRCEVESARVWADETLIAVLLTNLLDNARKASAPGAEIRVRCRRENRRVRIQVEDSGRGIPKEQLSRVTEAFYMVDKSRTRKDGGAGIGLALCKAIAEAHHGELGMESEPGRGTIVTVFLPLWEGEA